MYICIFSHFHLDVLSPWCITQIEWIVVRGMRFWNRYTAPYVLFQKSNANDTLMVKSSSNVFQTKVKPWCRINKRNRFIPFHQLVDINLTITKLFGNRIWLTLFISLFFLSVKIYIVSVSNACLLCLWSKSERRPPKKERWLNGKKEQTMHNAVSQQRL